MIEVTDEFKISSKDIVEIAKTIRLRWTTVWDF